MSDDIVRKYLLYRFDQGKDWQTVNSDYSAIQKFFKNVIMVRWTLTKLPRPRKEKKLPSILSKETVVKIIESAATFKQQVLLTFVYVTGARLSETIHVKIEDINSHRMQVRINQGKGNKDRFILLPQILIDLLREYYKREKPQVYLFNAKIKGLPYNQRSVQLAMQQGMTSNLHTFGSDIRLTGAAICGIKANDLALKGRNCKRRLAAGVGKYL